MQLRSEYGWSVHHLDVGHEHQGKGGLEDEVISEAMRRAGLQLEQKCKVNVKESPSPMGSSSITIDGLSVFFNKFMMRRATRSPKRSKIWMLI